MKLLTKLFKRRFLLTTALTNVLVLPLTAQWMPDNKLDASDRTASSGLGTSVALSGDYAIVGAPYDDNDENGLNPKTDAGSAYIYKRNSAGDWIQSQKLAAPDRNIEDWFGVSVSISGNYAIVGSYWNDYDAAGLNYLENAGAVYLYQLDAGGNWNYVEKWVAPDRREGDYFGWSVALNNGNSVIGAYYNGYNASDLDYQVNCGSAYIFSLNNTTLDWDFAQKIVSNDRGWYDYFGYAVAIHNDRIIVGACLDSKDENGLNPLTYAGSSYIFEKQSSGTWIQVEKIVASDRAEYDTHGSDVAIYGDYAVVGVYAESEDGTGANTKTRAGSCYIYKRTGVGDWIQVQKIVASDRTADYNFGHAVSICDSSILVGSTGCSTNMSGGSPIGGAGAAYLFHLNSMGIWAEAQKITAWDRNNVWEYFGTDVAIDWNRAIVGVPSELEDENGLNPISPPPGAAYIFSNASLPTAVVAPEENLLMSIYPNPTNGIINIKHSQQIAVTVYDALGQKIFASSFDAGLNQINLSPFSNGIYSLILETKEQHKSFKLIKTQ